LSGSATAAGSGSIDAHVSCDIDELVAAMTPESIDGETGTGDAIGNDSAEVS
jgi:hypothetical protein